MWEGQRERETQNPKWALGAELSAQSPMWGLNSRTRDHDLSRSRMPNRLSHPGAPMMPSFKYSITEAPVWLSWFKRPTLDFSSGSWDPAPCWALCRQHRAWLGFFLSLPLSLSAPPLLTFHLSLSKINKCLEKLTKCSLQETQVKDMVQEKKKSKKTFTEHLMLVSHVPSPIKIFILCYTNTNYTR